MKRNNMKVDNRVVFTICHDMNQLKFYNSTIMKIIVFIELLLKLRVNCKLHL